MGVVLCKDLLHFVVCFSFNLKLAAFFQIPEKFVERYLNGDSFQFSISQFNHKSLNVAF